MTAFVGNIFFERGDAASPEEFLRICQIFSMDGIGATNALVDATTMCSGGSMEYIPGLSDGAEFTVEGNYEQANADLGAMIDDVDAKIVKNYQIVIEDFSPHEVLSFAAVPLSWTLNPSVADRNTISFSFKISGAIIRS